MKYSSWSQVFANDPNSDSYDKNAVDVSNLIIDTISAAKYIKNIKKEPNFMYLSVEPITKAVQIIHHLIAVRLDPICFDDTKEFKVPSWASITGLPNAATVATTTTNARNLKLKFRHIIALPPFLAETIIASISKTPTELVVKFIATIKAFDTTHAADASFTPAIDA